MKPENEARFNKLLDYITTPERRRQVDNLNKYLKEHTAYFTAPASPKYHCNWEEGLVEHSMNVAENALKINAALGAGLRSEDLVICGLYHDVGKSFIELGEPYYLLKEASPKQKEWGYVPYPPYEYNQTPHVFLSVPERSVRLLTQFVNISDSMWQAIKGHDGAYVPENEHFSAHENPMLSIIQYADNWAGFHQEEIMKQSANGKSYIKVSQDKVGKYGYEVRISRTTEGLNE